MSANQADLTHIYRALKLMGAILEEIPELVNDDENALFVVAMLRCATVRRWHGEPWLYLKRRSRMSANQADLTHIYRALKLMGAILEESPELVNDDENALFVVAWQLVDEKLKQEYKT